MSLLPPAIDMNALPGFDPGPLDAKSLPLAARQRQEKHGRMESNLYSEKYRFAFLAVPKAANTAVKCALLPTVDHAADEVIDGVSIKRLVHKLGGGGVFAYTTKTQLVGMDLDLVFTVVRNTWDRLYSCYADKVRRDRNEHLAFRDYGIRANMPFKDFLEIVAATKDECAEIHFRSQWSLLTLGKRFLPNLVLQQHTLAEEWPMVQGYFQQRFGLRLEGVTTENRNQKRDSAYQTHYSSLTKDLVYQRFRDEIDYFGFEF